MKKNNRIRKLSLWNNGNTQCDQDRYPIKPVTASYTNNNDSSLPHLGESERKMGIVSPPTRIALIAPHPASKNGIGNYTDRLIEEMRLQASQYSILSPCDLLSLIPGHEKRHWNGRELPPHWPDVFLEAIDSTDTKLVHIQHGLYLGHGRSLSRFLVELHDRHIPCIITLHGIWPPNFFRHWPGPFYRRLAANVQQVIVHQCDGTLKLLQDEGIGTGKISIIPHGTWTKEETAPVNKPDSLGMENRKIVLFAGNIFKRKGLHIVIKAFPEVVRKIPEACLLVVGNERSDNVLDRAYRIWLHALMQKGLKDGWLIRRSEYVPDDELCARIAAAEVLVFPYLRRYGSASGVFHRALAAGRPTICSNIPTFAEAFDAWGENLPVLFPPPGDVNAWSRALIEILSDESLRKKAMAASLSLGCETSWFLVARKHLELYSSLLLSSQIQGEKRAS